MKKLLVVLMMLGMVVGCSKNVDSNEVVENTALPVVYIHTKEGEPVNKVNKEDSYAEFEIVYTNGQSFKVESDEDGNYPMRIKGRGNSSWTMPTEKKPYNLKFEEKVDLFGFGEAKKWCLIASWTDTSFMRNYIGYKLAKTLDEGSPDGEMVEVFIDDHYEGIYLLCEAYGIKEHRTETLDDGYDVTGDGEVSEFLIEADTRAQQNNEPNRFLTDSGYWMVIKDPDEDEITSPADERYQYVMNYYKKVDAAIMNLDHYEDYIDVDSLVDMYVINEYLKNPDYGYGNQPYYASTFMYMQEGGKLCFGPVWDVDLSMGRNDYREIELEGFRDSYSPEGFLAKNTQWINKLMEDPNFVAKVKERWAEFKPEVEKMINEIAPTMKEKIAKTQAYDFETWDEKPKDRTTEWSYRTPLNFEEEYNYIIDFMKTRLAWMDEQY